MMNGGIGMMPWGFSGFLLSLLLVFLFIVAVVAVVKWVWGQNMPPLLKGGGSVLDILKKRYARGEIDKEEYERIKRDIE